MHNIPLQSFSFLWLFKFEVQMKLPTFFVCIFNFKMHYYPHFTIIRLWKWWLSLVFLGLWLKMNTSKSLFIKNFSLYDSQGLITSPKHLLLFLWNFQWSLYYLAMFWFLISNGLYLRPLLILLTYNSFTFIVSIWNKGNEKLWDISTL